jgi:hypothetical protein
MSDKPGDYKAQAAMTPAAPPEKMTLPGLVTWLNTFAEAQDNLAAGAAEDADHWHHVSVAERIREAARRLTPRVGDDKCDCTHVCDHGRGCQVDAERKQRATPRVVDDEPEFPQEDLPTAEDVRGIMALSAPPAASAERMTDSPSPGCYCPSCLSALPKGPSDNGEHDDKEN